MSKRLISIFTPVYNEERNIPVLYERVKEVMHPLSDRYDYEHVFSDNASQDRSFFILKDLHERDTSVKIIRLSKNFGVTKNTLNGLSHCSGDAVVQIDADLQDPPELIPEFIQKWEEGYKVVYGIRKGREESWPMLVIRKAFYRTANKLSSETLIPDVGEFRLMDRRILEELKKINDYNPYLRGIIANLGFKQIGIPYQRKARRRGRSSHNLFTLIDYGINGIVSHSRVLLRLSTITGIFLASLTFVAAWVYIILKLLKEDVPAGITSILAFILFFAGIQMIFLGIIGEYIARIFDQSIKKPLVIEEELLGFDRSNAESRLNSF